MLYKYKGKEKEVVIPDLVTNIGYLAFSSCSSLTNIGGSAFRRCSELVIKASEKSYAIKYAKENDIKYEII